MFHKMKYFVLGMCLFIAGGSQTFATIQEIKQIESILPEIQDTDTLILFNIAEVIMDSPLDLGTSAWRKYIRARAPQHHDALTLFAARNIAAKAVEEATPQIIATCQNQGLPVLAFTSRGRTEWYTTEVEGVDQLTEDMLGQIQIDFNKTQLPEQWRYIENSVFSPYFHHGIIYANHMEKGDFLKQLLQETGYVPSKVVFVDDKRDSLEGVERALQELGIPFAGFWYTKTASDHKGFSAMISHVQLQSLVFDGILLSDEEAAKIVNESYQGVNPDTLFFEILERLDIDSLNRV